MRVAFSLALIGCGSTPPPPAPTPSPPQAAVAADAAPIAVTPDAAAPAIDGYTVENLGRAVDVMLAPDGSTIAILDESIRVRERDAKTPRFSTAITAGFRDRAYNGRFVTIAGFDRANMIDAMTGALTDVPCPGGLLGVATTPERFALICNGGVVVWATDSNTEVTRYPIGADSIVHSNNIHHTYRVTRTGAVIDETSHGTALVFGPKGGERRIKAMRDWECDRESCADRFARVLPDAATYVVATGNGAGESVRSGDVVEMGPPRKVMLELRDVATNKVIASTQVSSRIRGLDVAATVAVATVGTGIQIYSLPSLRRVAEVEGLTDFSDENRLSADGVRYVFGNRSGIDVVDTATGAKQHFACDMGYGVTFRFLAKTTVLVTGSRGGESGCVGAYDLVTGTKITRLPVLGISDDHRTILTADRESFLLFKK